ncbi:MAG: discoidin domain-containing protein [Saprospiraceae bacterium]|nr:discoidin domain-containing protein [Saprospiraceae bacterium]
MRRFLLPFPLLFLAVQVLADIRLPTIFGSHMVLQQQSELQFWGWAAPNEEVRVLCSWLPGQSFDARADRATLKWVVSIPVPAADLLPHTITIKGGWFDLVLENILFGEVWLCSGQSNMEWQPAWGNLTISEAQYEAANDPGLRLFSVQRSSLPTPQDNCVGHWAPSTRASMRQFSATAYFFGRMLRDRLGVPVGLINTSWGGTAVESWIPEPSLSSLAAQLNRDDHPVWNYGRAGSLYNGMIAPLKTLKIKGFLWYQGETNTYNPEAYAGLLALLVAEWRKDFGAAAPFYNVQIAPFQYGAPKIGALVRDQQRQAQQKIANSGLVVVSDIGNIHDIHPQNTVDVGYRLAAWALSNTYGQQGLPVSGPLYRAHQVGNDRVRVFFDYADTGLRALGGPLRDFELAGADQQFYPAEARIEGQEVVVWTPQVPRPVALRFAMENTSEPNLVNGQGLPASCFRTDNWRVHFPGIRFGLQGLSPEGLALLRLNCPDPDYTVRYSTDGRQPEVSSPLLAPGQALPLAPGGKLLARVFDAAGTPAPAVDTIVLSPHQAFGRTCVLGTKPSPRKAGNSAALTLVDGRFGGAAAGDDAWQGFEGNDAEWTIDLGQMQTLRSISAGFLSATADRAFLPVALEFSISADGRAFTSISQQSEPVPSGDTPPQRKVYRAATTEKARYVRVSARNMGRIPDWSSSKGGPAWIFADEIVVE